jgi:hypothetical protein
VRRALWNLVILTFLVFPACVKVDVSIPTTAVLSPPGGHPNDPGKNKPISLADLKTIQGPGGSCTKGDKSLDVSESVEMQLTPTWCWASAAHLVMGYQKVPTRQCDLAMKYYGLNRGPEYCCQPLIKTRYGALEIDVIDAPNECVRSGWPGFLFDKVNFDYYRTVVALDWEALTQEICLDNPFIYVVKWAGGGLHALVVKGYHSGGANQPIVQVFDPMSATPVDATGKPLPNKDYEDLTYDEYVGGKEGHEYTHFADYAQIRPH